MKYLKRFPLIILSCLAGLLLLTGCSENPSGSSVQSQKDAVLSALNASRKSNGVATLYEDDQADIIAARLANAAVDYYCDNISEKQFETEFYNAGLTKLNGKYYAAIYADTIIPTNASTFTNEKISHVDARIVGIAIRQYKNFRTTVLIAYP